MKLKKLNKCNNCGHSNRLYRILMGSFLDIDMFYCTLQEKIIDNGDTCENWTRKARKYDLSKQRFDEIIEDIKYIDKFVDSKNKKIH